MDQDLMRQIASITEEEERILAGTPLDRDIYTTRGDFVVSSDKMTGGMRDITVRTHTRYTPFPTHKHNYLEIMIVLSGSITHRISGEEIALGEGDILVMNKHVAHSIDRADTPDIGVNIILSDSFANSLAKELSETVFSELAEQNSMPDGSGIYLCFSAKGHKPITNIIENLLFELTEYPSNTEILRYTVALLFDYLSRSSESLLRIASRLPDRDGVRRAQILGYIHTSYKTATLSELSELVFLSVPYLSKLIGEYFGKTFKELLSEERMARATDLIKKTTLPIGEIINSVGYENESYFHREFKRKTGKTPLAVRKSARDELGKNL